MIKALTDKEEIFHLMKEVWIRLYSIIQVVSLQYIVFFHLLLVVIVCLSVFIEVPAWISFIVFKALFNQII